MKKIAALILAAALALGLTGCGKWGILGGGTASSAKVTSDSNSDGTHNYYGEPGETFTTCFFDFSIDSVDVVSQWDGVQAADGMAFVDAVVSIQNTFGEDLPMSVYDFEITWGDFSDSEYDFEYETFWTDENAMPEQYTLADGDSTTEHMIYQVPQAALSDTCIIVFQETFEDETTGDTFLVYFQPQQAASAEQTAI